MVPHHSVRARTLRAPTTLTERKMDTNEQLKALHELRDRLRAVLPSRFDVNVRAPHAADQSVVVWDTREEQQTEYTHATPVSTVITRLLRSERRSGEVAGATEVASNIKKALGI